MMKEPEKALIFLIVFRNFKKEYILSSMDDNLVNFEPVAFSSLNRAKSYYRKLLKTFYDPNYLRSVIGSKKVPKREQRQNINYLLKSRPACLGIPKQHYKDILAA
ncbi:MAG TPA: hypothetical protein VL053_19270 [Arachidicoccus sp.]|nr:hypothetical protein [Arachidicoccus sp.]